MTFPILTAEEAASHIRHGDSVGLGGFTTGAPKLVTKALARQARRRHSRGEAFKINLYTGASTPDSVDGELTRAGAIGQRMPYQATPCTRQAVNDGTIHFYDPHLSHVSQDLRYGFAGPLDVAIIEVTELADNGEAVLGTGVGMTPTIAHLARKIIIELTSYYEELSFRGFHDNYIPADPPRRREIPVYRASDRIGSEVLRLNPSKIVGVVLSDAVDTVHSFTKLNGTTRAIGRNVASFFGQELRAGLLPREFLPVQSGVGNIANAALYGLAENPEIPCFEMYTEVVQEAVMDLMELGKCRFASTSGVMFSEEGMQRFRENLEFYRERLLMRPSEISNHPEVIRRLGVIAMNTALECDIYGNVNSTHVNGSVMMNGLGGSGDFCRNAWLSVFLCPSVQKEGRLSAIVPMVTHVDHSDHSVKVIVTEQGIADMRGKDPRQRAQLIIDNCVHPDYKELLRDYLRLASAGHISHRLRASFALHLTYEECGDMRLTDFSKFGF